MTKKEALDTASQFVQVIVMGSSEQELERAGEHDVLIKMTERARRAAPDLWEGFKQHVADKQWSAMVRVSRDIEKRRFSGGTTMPILGLQMASAPAPHPTAGYVLEIERVKRQRAADIQARPRGELAVKCAERLLREEIGDDAFYRLRTSHDRAHVAGTPEASEQQARLLREPRPEPSERLLSERVAGHQRRGLSHGNASLLVTLEDGAKLSHHFLKVEKDGVALSGHARVQTLHEWVRGQTGSDVIVSAAAGALPIAPRNFNDQDPTWRSVCEQYGLK